MLSTQSETPRSYEWLQPRAKRTAARNLPGKSETKQTSKAPNSLVRTPHSTAPSSLAHTHTARRQAHSRTLHTPYPHSVIPSPARRRTSPHSSRTAPFAGALSRTEPRPTRAAGASGTTSASAGHVARGPPPRAPAAGATAAPHPAPPAASGPSRQRPLPMGSRAETPSSRTGAAQGAAAGAARGAVACGSTAARGWTLDRSAPGQRSTHARPCTPGGAAAGPAPTR